MENLLCIADVMGAKKRTDRGTRSEADYLRTHGLVNTIAGGLSAGNPR
jgi:hypothetical protein